jgi:hypothetical protein
MLPTKSEVVLNLKTAKALGLDAGLVHRLVGDEFVRRQPGTCRTKSNETTASA